MKWGLSLSLLALALLLTGAVSAAGIDPLATTAIAAPDRADLDRGESALFPIRIANFGTKTATYTLALDGTQGWGTWRVDPTSTVTLPPGEETILYVHLDTDRYARPGPRDVTFTITSAGKTAALPMHVSLRAPMQTFPAWLVFLQTILLGLFLLLLVIAVFLAARRFKKSSPKPRKADDRVEVVDIKQDAPRAKTTDKIPARRRTIAVEPAPSKKRLETHY